MATTATTATTAELQATLAKFEKARDDYLIGRVGVKVDYDGYSVELNRTNITMISGRIRELKRALGQPVGRRSFGTCY